MLIDKVSSCSVPSYSMTSEVPSSTTKGITSIELSTSWFLIHYRMIVYKFTFNSSAIFAAFFVLAMIVAVTVLVIVALTSKKIKNKSG